MKLHVQELELNTGLVLIKLIDNSVSEMGLVIPESSRSPRATVIIRGSDIDSNQKDIAYLSEPGDSVLLKVGYGYQEFEYEGEKYRIIQDSDVLLVYEKEDSERV